MLAVHPISSLISSKAVRPSVTNGRPTFLSSHFQHFDTINMCLLTCSATPCDHSKCETPTDPVVPKSLPAIGVPSEVLNATLAEVNQLLGQVMQQNQALQGCLQLVQRHYGTLGRHSPAFRPGSEVVKGYLDLVTEVPTQVFKEKGFGLTLRIMASLGVACCVSGLHFRVQLYTEDAPPAKVALNISGKKVLRGSIDAYSDSQGIVTFPNIVINEVSSHYLNNSFSLVVSQSGEQNIRAFVLPSLVVKARKQGKVSYKTSIADIDDLTMGCSDAIR